MSEDETPGIGFLSFLRLCLQETVKTTYDKTDKVATAVGFAIGVIVHYIPAWEHAMNSIAWEIPVACLASVTATRLLLSPWLVYRRRDTQARTAEAALEQRAGIKFKIMCLTHLIDRGEEFLRQCRATKNLAPSEQVNAWATEAAESVKEIFDSSYISQLGSGVGVQPPQVYLPNPDNLSIYGSIYVYVYRLRELVKELPAPLGPVVSL